MQLNELMTLALNPPPAQTQPRSAPRIWRDGQANRAPYRRHLQIGPQNGLLQCHRQADDDVVTLAAKYRMWRHRDFYQGVTGPPIADPRHALAFKPNDLPVLHARGYVHIEGPPVRQGDPTCRPVDGVQKIQAELVVGVLATHGKPASSSARTASAAKRMGEDALEVVGIEAGIRAVLVAATGIAEIAV